MASSDPAVRVNENRKSQRIGGILLAILAALSIGRAARAFEPAPLPELVTETDEDAAPFYLFLFTHTEDPFNHRPSERRYAEFAPLVARLAATHPDEHIVWTIEFMGSDAKTVLDRDPETGIATMLRKYADTGVIEFGYHAHHEPTYLNRPQRRLSPGSSWEEKVEGMDEWISCEKALPPVDSELVAPGDCVAPDEGGLRAVQRFGEVEIVTGLHLYADANVEHDTSVHATRRYLPDRRVGFGYPDHGALAVDRAWVAARDELMARLTPSVHTSSTLIWADNILRVNDGDLLGGVPTINLLEGPDFAREVFAAMDRSRPHVINVGLASKYHYTAEGTSPTIYGYSHPDHPQLPPALRLSPSAENEGYRRAKQALRTLVDELVPGTPGVRFVNADEIEELAAPAAYFEVSDDDLDVIARWVLVRWDAGPPDWVSDGLDFYSLRDALVLLSRAIADRYPPTLHLTDVYGPFDVELTHDAVTVPAATIEALARLLAVDLEPDASWETTPSNIIQPAYEVAGVDLDPAQVLYGLATLYASSFAGTPVDEVTIPAGSSMPGTLALLEAMGCEDCQGTAWSLKPARIRELR